MSDIFLSIIVPAFNEEVRIVSTVEELVRYLGDQSYRWEVVVVDDGSVDRTVDLVTAEAAKHDDVRVEQVEHKGKGWAVKHGMLASRGRYRFMCDADLAMPIEQLSRFLRRMEDGYDVVIGSRQMAGARRFNEPAVRHLIGRVFNRVVRLMAVGDFQDTQCGFKCFRGEVAEDLFRLQRTTGFGFDVEILFLACKRGLRVREEAIDWYHQKESKVRPIVDAFLMLWDTVRVRWHDLAGRYASGRAPVVKQETGPDTAGGAGGSGPGPDQETLDTGRRSPDAEASVAVVIPTYNEAENLPQLARRLFDLNISGLRLIVVDDGSPDGTGEVAKGLSEKFDGRVELIQRGRKQGIGTAYVAGFSRALADGVEYVLQMDADLSHSPEAVPELLNGLRQADVVVGSRYVGKEGEDQRSGAARRLLSSLANAGIRAVAGLRVRDATSGFKGFRSSVLRSIDLEQFRCTGFAFQAEVAHACQRAGYRVLEHPIIFVNRTTGESKMSVFIVLEALWRLLPLRWRR